jgi:hypothetical protein
MSPRNPKRVRNESLFGAQDKLDRAREHFHQLEAEQLRFQKEHPEPLRFAFGIDDADPKGIVVFLDYLEGLDSRFSIVLGDMVHDLRCVLDYLAWEVVKLGTNAPGENSDAAAEVDFPIIVSGKHIKSGAWWPASKVFREARLQHLPGVQDVPLGIIERYQPYKRGNLAERHPLARLQRLSNIDKHRRPHVALMIPAFGGFHVNTPPGCRITSFEWSKGLQRQDPLSVGMHLAYFTVADRTLCNGMEIEPTTHVFIGLEDDVGPAMDNLLAVESTLGDLLLEIDAVL